MAGGGAGGREQGRGTCPHFLANWTRKRSVIIIVIIIISNFRLFLCNLQSACKFTLNLISFLANGVRGRLACPSGALTLVASWSE